MSPRLSDVSAACTNGRCRSYQPGHNTHTVRATLAGQTPQDWQPAVVEEVNGLAVTLVVAGGQDPTLVWHHRPLDGELTAGDEIRIHRTHPLIEVGSSWISVAHAD